MSLAAEGAFSIGLKVGRRSADLGLMDFVGTIRHQLRATHPYPTPEGILDFATSGIAELLTAVPQGRQDRLAGVGIATPFELWNWAEEVGASRRKMAAWRRFDLAATLRARMPWPVFVQNDATAACGAELVFGCGADYPDFVYFFIGSFVGGGIVLNGAVHAGRTGNAGALGSMPVPSRIGQARQLIDQASIVVLERDLRERGLDPSVLWRQPNDWSALGAPLAAWIDNTARHLAHAIVASCSVIDFAAAIIDGAFPADVRANIVAATGQAIARMDLRGIRPPRVHAGTIGANARVVGAASLPLFARYLVDPSVLFKSAA
jgi:predicted NBD/HSP70 family sugar kinase